VVSNGNYSPIGSLLKLIVMILLRRCLECLKNYF
jgi:hypothetical protein